jgi:hypothetical protein
METAPVFGFTPPFHSLTCEPPVMQCGVIPAFVRALIVLGAIALLLAGLGWIFPLNDAIWIGGDDGFELSKSLLLARDPEAARLMWNDQPWLHTLITSGLFRLFGEHAALPRLFSALSLVAMLLAMRHLLIPERNGESGSSVQASKSIASGKPLLQREHLLERPGNALCLEVILAGLFLITADEMAYLSLSAMVEIPAFSWALVSAALAFRGGSALWRFAASGLVFAAAVHIKFTALLVLPGIGLLLLFQAGSGRIIVRNLAAWGAGFVIAFACFVAISPTFDFGQILLTHLRSRESLFLQGQIGPAFEVRYLLQNPALLLGTAAGVWVLFHALFFGREGGRLRLAGHQPVLLFALALLISASAAAWLHKPWWKFYLVHFNVPMSLLAGVGTAWVLRRALQCIDFGVFRSTPMAVSTPMRSTPFSALLGTGVISLWAGFTLPEFIKSGWQIFDRPRASTDAIVQAMKNYSGQAHWAFTKSGAYAFHGGAVIPPELVVISQKRYWSKQISDSDILATTIRYEPELLSLKKRRHLADEAWVEWVRERYVLVAQNELEELWVRNILAPLGLPRDDSRLASLDL